MSFQTVQNLAGCARYQRSKPKGKALQSLFGCFPENHKRSTSYLNPAAMRRHTINHPDNLDDESKEALLLAFARFRIEPEETDPGSDKSEHDSDDSDEDSTTTPQPSKVFRFFDLPREIRDMIFRKLPGNASVPALNEIYQGFHGQVFGCATANMQGVSSRFRQEYEREVALRYEQTLEVFLAEPYHKEKQLRTMQEFARNEEILGPISGMLGKVKVVVVNLHCNLFRQDYSPAFARKRHALRKPMNAHMSYLPAVTKAIVRPDCSTTHFVTHILGSGRLYELSEPAIRNWLFMRAVREDMGIELVFCLNQPLLTIWPGSDAPASDYKDQDAWWADQSLTYFEGRFSTGPYTWMGLEFETASWKVAYPYGR